METLYPFASQVPTALLLYLGAVLIMAGAIWQAVIFYRNRARRDTPDFRPASLKPPLVIYASALCIAAVAITAVAIQAFTLHPTGLESVSLSASTDSASPSKATAPTNRKSTQLSADQSGGTIEMTAQGQATLSKSRHQPQSGGPAWPQNQEPVATPAMFDLLIAQHTGFNTFVQTADDNLSTFALDGDTASYQIAKNHYLQVGTVPPADLVRIEEFVNAIDQGYQPAEDDLEFRIDAGPSPFGDEDDIHLVRIGITAPKPDFQRSQPISLVFLLDTSGSMADTPYRLATDLIEDIIDHTDDRDRIALVTYANRAQTWFEMSPVSQAAPDILHAIERINPTGRTNLSAGVIDAYTLAASELADGRTRVRIALLSDGTGNLGILEAQSIHDQISDADADDTTLISIGIGDSNYNDVMLEQLANLGNGTYHYVHNQKDLDHFRDHYMHNIFMNSPRDARVQIEFNPDAVDKYRLIGYENRMVDDQDFANDELDFGEPGFARDVTALYEVVLDTGAIPSDQLFEASLRWQNGDTGKITQTNTTFLISQISDQSRDLPPHFHRTAAVAELAEILRNSPYGDCNAIDHILSLIADHPVDEEDHTIRQITQAAASDIPCG